MGTERAPRLGSLGVVWAFVIGTVIAAVAPGVGRSNVTHATTSCVSGSVTTSVVTDSLFTDTTLEVDDPALRDKTQLYRFTRHLFRAGSGVDGSCTWVAPRGVRYSKLFVMGGGGAGGNHLGGGGGGGGGALKKMVSLTAGQSYEVVVGAGGRPAAAECQGATCIGGDGGSSSISVNGLSILSASGGGGGGGDESAGRSMSCLGFDGCGGGGGGAAPPRNYEVNGRRSIAGGSGGVSSSAGLAVTGEAGEGQSGLSSNTACCGSHRVSGGGGGWTNNNVYVAGFGNDGHPLPATITGTMHEAVSFGTGGGGVIHFFSSPYFDPGVRSRGSLDWDSTNMTYAASGGSGASQSAPATSGRHDYGGGGGGGGVPPNVPEWSTNFIVGGAGGNGQVSIMYLQIPSITGSSVVTHQYGRTSTVQFAATGGNNELATSTQIDSQIQYSWSITNTQGRSIPGISISNTGAVSIGSNIGIGTVSAVVRATDGAGTTGQLTISITTSRGPQNPVAFVTGAPVDHHPGGDSYFPRISGGSGTGAYVISVDGGSAGVCSKASNENASAVQFLAVGQCILTGHRAGDFSYLDSEVVTQTVVVTAPEDQDPVYFTSSPPAIVSVGGETYAATITGGSGSGAHVVDVSESSAAVCTKASSVNGSVVQFVGPGSCILEGRRLGDYDYAESAVVTQTVTVGNKILQPALSFGVTMPSSVNIGQQLLLLPQGGGGTAPFELSVAPSSQSVCSLVNATITAIDSGFCRFTLNRAGDDNFLAATEISGSFYAVAGRDLSLASPVQRVWTYSGVDLVTSVGAAVSAGAPFSVAFVATDESTNCSFGHPSRYDLAFTGPGVCRIYVAENDNAFSYTQSPFYDFFVVAAGDTQAPSVVSATAPGFVGRFLEGGTVDISIKFSERVVVTGTPKILLETGDTDREATYLSGSYSDTLIFRYVVQSGDFSALLDYESDMALSPNGGSIEDLSGNDAQLALPAVGSAASLSGSASILVGASTTTTTSSTSSSSTSSSTTTTLAMDTSTSSTSTTTPEVTIGLDAPIVGIAKVTSDGFWFLVRNYDAEYSYSFSLPSGYTASWANQAVGLVAVSGGAPGELISVDITASDGIGTASASLEARTLVSGIAPTFGDVTPIERGFRVPVTNFDPAATYVVAVGSGFLDDGVLHVSNVAPGTRGSVTLEVARSGYVRASATVQGSALPEVQEVPSGNPESSAGAKDIAVVADGRQVDTPSAPAALARPRPKIGVGRSVALRVLLRKAGITAKPQSILSVAPTSASRKFCALKGSRVVGLRRGVCRLTVAIRAESRSTRTRPSGKRISRQTAVISVG